MSLKNMRWVMTDPHSVISDELIARYHIGPLLKLVLESRNIVTELQIREVMMLDSVVCDPYLMKDLSKGVDIIRKALGEQKKITVFGDYDVDGLTSSYVLSDWLNKHGAFCDVYIPDREGEGYGMTRSALEKLKDNGTELIITVDNGISAVEEAKVAAELGLEMVVTDHHNPGPVLPDCLAVIDPRRSDCPYPNKALAGVGVVFKLVCALDEGGLPAVMKQYGDMFALGTVADVCEITPENRFLLMSAEKILKNTQNFGLKILAQKAGCPSPSLNDIGFRLAPRINAAGRVGSSFDAFKLLSASNENEAELYAQILSEDNSKRQVMETKILSESRALIENENPDYHHALVLYNESWRLGVLGIVAAKIADEYHCPVIMLSNDSEMIKGSARSGGDFDVFSALTRASEGIASCGGHRQAAGVRIPFENLNQFKQRFYAITQKEIPEEGLSAELCPDAFPLWDDISVNHVLDLEKLAPFGPGNPQPLFGMTDVMVSAVRSIGDGKHTKFTLTSSNHSFSALLFGCSESNCGVRAGDFVDVIFTLETNTFRGLTDVSLMIKDIVLSSAHSLQILKDAKKGLSVPSSLKPGRADCAAVWRFLNRQNSFESFYDLSNNLSLYGKVRSFSTLISLIAFEQSGLIRIQGNPETIDSPITIELIRDTGRKVDLFAADIFSVFSESFFRKEL